MAEDLGAEPLYVVNAGMSCQARSPEIISSATELEPYVADVLDAIEYANGPATSKWGAERAKNGRPEPFNLKYVEIGNENSGNPYFKNYKIFYDAIKARYPQMTTIADVPVPNAPVEIVDEHFYAGPGFFFNNAGKYDGYDRKGPKIYVGEYACNSGVGSGSLYGALSEAAFMIGMERNSDVVILSSYAPLFENVNNRFWPVNLIQFDGARSVGRTSYQVQKLFSENRPDTVLKTEVAAPTVAASTPSGYVGVGTWNTQAEFRDTEVTDKFRPVLICDFSRGTEGWGFTGGEWKAQDSALRQTSDRPDCRAFAGNPTWHDYVYTLRARKIGGNEGFLVMFLVQNNSNWVRWNLGGSGNTQHVVEQSIGGTKVNLCDPVPGEIKTDQWYNVRVEVKGRHADCFLNGMLVHRVDVKTEEPPTFFALAGRTEKADQVVLKVVNSAANPVDTTLKIAGAGKISSKASVITLSSDNQTDENTLDEPKKVVPVASSFEGVGEEFKYTFKPHSLTILRIYGVQEAKKP
jgi:alpha-L-arabinofuranosidase